MFTVLKFQSPFERLKSYAATPEVGLCKAIITQAIIDSTSFTSSHESRKLRLEAIWWIFGDSSDFHEICDGAMMEPSFVRKIATEAISLRSSIQ